MANILVVDDETSICTMLEIALRRDSHRVETVTSGEIAKRRIDAALYDVIVTDIRMPDISGIDVLRYAHQVSPDTAVILITAFADVDAAMAAAKAGGVSDFIIKGPSLHEHVRLSVRRAGEQVTLRRENSLLRRDAMSRNGADHIIGDSAPIIALKQRVVAVAATASTILIRGESGTGKELVARAVHACSPRAAAPFVSVNCGAFPESLLESELFGYVRGAFTGASQNKRGLFEAASGGTIFLDEISEMPPSMQVKLLRVLQERTVRPVGGTTEVPVDVRVVAASNKNLDAMVAESTFREDLYYRLSVIPVSVPALRERPEDIPLLANHFLKKYAPAAGKSITRIDAASLDAACDYEWPGNVRQLENTVERAVALANGETLVIELPEERPKARAMAAAATAGIPALIAPGMMKLPQGGIDMEGFVADLERSLLQSALKECGGVQTKAASLLQLSYRSFRHLMKKYDL